MAAVLTDEIMQSLPGYLPPEHRRCVRCRKPMRPRIDWRDRKDGEVGVRRYNGFMVPVKIDWYGYGPENLFCTLRCAYRYACHKAANSDRN